MPERPVANDHSPAALVALVSVSLLAFQGFSRWQRAQLSGGVTGGDRAATRPTILYFRSDACAPCQTQARILDVLTAQYQGGLTVQRIDTDEEPEMARRYHVLTLPTTLIMDKKGQVHHINYGLADTRKLARQLESVG